MTVKKKRKYTKRAKKTESTPKVTKNDEKVTESIENSLLPQKDLFRIDEVAEYFSVSEQCIRTWIAHGHLKKENIVGVARIPRQAILDCRFNKKQGA